MKGWMRKCWKSELRVENDEMKNLSEGKSNIVLMEDGGHAE